jgi:hypothetical protein
LCEVLGIGKPFCGDKNLTSGFFWREEKRDCLGRRTEFVVIMVIFCILMVVWVMQVYICIKTHEMVPLDLSISCYVNFTTKEKISFQLAYKYVITPVKEIHTEIFRGQCIHECI